MYRYLEGKLSVKEATQAVIDVGGIGFEVSIPLSTFHSLPAVGERVKVLTHFNVREDAHQLFGFLTEEERDLFRLLLTVSGIGPKMALTVLSGIGVGELKDAIVNERLEILTAISGIGRKTAERMIVELREKMVLDEKFKKKKSSPGSPEEESSEIFSTGLSALAQLGYKKQEAADAIRKVIAKKGQKITVEDLVRESLKTI